MLREYISNIIQKLKIEKYSPEDKYPIKIFTDDITNIFKSDDEDDEDNFSNILKI